ncbi:BMP family ABC transporter substrate-binding protein [Balneatrix alpica]|uniref:BMP family ABC transporter substrate-binding protein n=1 Tax=Balneatrix alpica TaxID=75684 RepID=UPI00273A18E9|nr:BMP family ABC transporter substrate-binding protein [Balneatrix alpica]
MKRVLMVPTLMAAMMAVSVAQADPLKVGFVYVGPVGDAGWTAKHDQGRQCLEQQLGDKVSTSYVESVPEGADAERVIENLARTGHKLIFTTSFGYMNPTLKVAKKFKDVKFEHATGYKTADNVSNYFTRAYQGRYLTGMVAGKMTKSNVIGYIGAFPIPEVVRGINAFTQGLREVNPEAKVKVVWINSWYDPAKEREAAEALMQQGADVLNTHSDSPAAIQAAEAKGVYAMGYHDDMSEFGPKAHLTATMHNWCNYYVERAQAVLDGSWTSQSSWPGMEAGTTHLAPYNEAIPADVVAMVEKRKQEIIEGSYKVFTGPVRDQSGAERVPAGEVMSDGAMLGFDWYVEGVEGELPK